MGYLFGWKGYKLACRFVDAIVRKTENNYVLDTFRAVLTTYYLLCTVHLPSLVNCLIGLLFVDIR